MGVGIIGLGCVVGNAELVLDLRGVTRRLEAPNLVRL
jgi:hypothetical protein